MVISFKNHCLYYFISIFWNLCFLKPDKTMFKYKINDIPLEYISNNCLYTEEHTGLLPDDKGTKATECWLCRRNPTQRFRSCFWRRIHHYNDVIMGAIASQITSLTIVFSIVYLDTDQRKHQSSASLAFAGKSPEAGEFRVQMASNVENVSIWCRHHA